MGVEATQVGKLAHAVFLNRMSDQPATSPEVRLGQGGFLALRLADLLAPDRPPAEPDVFQYQLTATERYCAELAHEGTEAAHLIGIVRAVADSYRQGDVRLMAPNLFAYVHHLEQTLRWEEALDVIQTLALIGGDRMSSADQVATQLRLGLLNRNLARFEEADAAYAAAEHLAGAAGDRPSILLSRVGRAIGLMKRGNLPECERSLRVVLADAKAWECRDAEARAEHVLGNVLDTRGQAAEGAPHVWRAYELYEDEAAKLRALGDLGLLLLRVGDAVAAEHALREVVRRGQQGDAVVNAKIELMHCASYRNDRVGFERWRAELNTCVDDMPPNVLADFYLKSGVGSARFGNVARGRQWLERAVGVATAHGLHEVEFRIEGIKAGLDDGETAASKQAYAAAEPSFESEELREVSASLALLAP